MKFSARRGFTLIELLVVIAIIAVLSVIGVAVFRGVTSAARDTKRRSDVDAIRKAYEINYSNGAYQTLTDTQFASGKIPTPPEGGNYTILQNPTSTGYTVCAALENSSSPVCTGQSSTCSCQSSSQDLAPTSTSYNVISGPSGGTSVCKSSLYSGLIGFWRMDETSSPFNDTSGQVNNAIWLGGINSVAGKFSNAGNFDGTTGYATIGTPPVLDFPLSSSLRLSISLWIKPSRVNTAQYLIDRGINGSDGWGLYLNGNNVSFGGHGGGTSWTTANPISTANQWYHIVAVGGDGGQTGKPSYIYVNGNPQTLGGNNFITLGGIPVGYSISTLTSTTNSVIIGQASDPAVTSDFFGGLIDDVRVYNRELTSTDVTDLYGNNGNGCISP